ncbi:hypothetical protein BD410DRAFT_824358 [Rickenella mellea]|uniref:RlpA-like protein double-psi beta-barrel domain-containing protein n=1 Tax=Rickenella mellea TaxID=50990 RepID=A0A4Y7QN80_9AGAM|nr:hypothetical protein BD410DRAFT_824358 [Rickenella mellea]
MARFSILTYKSLIVLCLAAVAAAMLNRLDARFESKDAHRRMIPHSKRTVTPNPPQCKRKTNGTSPAHTGVSNTLTGSGSGVPTKTTDGSSGTGMPKAIQATGTNAVTPVASYPCPPFQSSWLSGSHVGAMTYFDATGNGGCGDSQTEQMPLVAVSHCLFDHVAPDNPNKASFCHKTIKISFNGDGHGSGDMSTAIVPVLDKCMGCDPYSIDLSLAAWHKLTTAAPTRFLDVTWEWVDE